MDEWNANLEVNWLLSRLWASKYKSQASNQDPSNFSTCAFITPLSSGGKKKLFGHSVNICCISKWMKIHVSPPITSIFYTIFTCKALYEQVPENIQNKLIILLNYITKTYITKNGVYLFYQYICFSFFLSFFFFDSDLSSTLFMEKFLWSNYFWRKTKKRQTFLVY